MRKTVVRELVWPPFIHFRSYRFDQFLQMIGQVGLSINIGLWVLTEAENQVGVQIWCENL